MIFPLVFSTCSDAVVSLGRIGSFLTAEELEKPYEIDEEMKWAVKANATFAWETVEKVAASPGGKFGAEAGAKPKDKKDGPVLPTTADEGASSGEPKPEEGSDEKPFELHDVQINVPRGSFVAIVGRVGSGKSSLLQGLVGEMRRVSGEVRMVH